MSGEQSEIPVSRGLGSIPAALSAFAALLQVRVGEPAAHCWGLQPVSHEGSLLQLGWVQQRDDLKPGHGAAQHIQQEAAERLQGVRVVIRVWGFMG